MISRRHSAALILFALTSCADSAREIGAAAPAADQCFSLSTALAFDQAADSSLRVGTGGRIFELELAGDCAGFGGAGIATIEAGSSNPFCVGQPGGRELIISYPVTQQSNVCRIEAVRRVSLDTAN